MSNPTASATAEFILTKEYHRFAEFCDACRRYHYIGICHGPPGVGKTLSARHYAQWALLESLLPDYLSGENWPPEVKGCRTLFYTASVENNPKRLTLELDRLRHSLNYLLEDITAAEQGLKPRTWPPDLIELILVDESERLKTASLEQLRDLFDQGHFGLVLIGMPGLEKRLARYPQLYSRVGFVHQFNPLSAEEARFILQHKWQKLGLTLQMDDFTDLEAMATILRMTGGNFRLMQRLCTQIERILQINERRTVTKEVVEAARESLVIGLA